MSDISSSDYKRPGTLKFWCQKVLPLVYDDSLSYYELLCKVVDYINNLIHDNSATIDNMDALLNAFNQLQDYVNESFDELNVYNEVSEKIDRMAEDGELLEILEPVTDELTQYVRDQATAQQEYNTQTRNQTSSAIAQQNIYNQNTRDMVSAMVGHPFTASTPSQMSDTTKIYVYTGATGGGYTYGHWYYYNGSAWTDGGEYNSTTIELDRSLNIPDTAADAGSVGVRLRQFAPRESWTSNYRLNPSTGAAESYTGQSTEHAITDFIDCVDMSDILGFDYTSGLGGIITCSVFIYDENSTYLGYIFNSAQYGYVTPGGTMSPLASAPAFQKIRFDVNITTYTAEQFPYNYLDIMTVRRIGTDKSLKAINVPADAEAVGIEITHVKQDINELEEGKADASGTSENLTAGNAEQLLTDKGVTDKVPYLFRASGGNGADREEDKIVGGTVAWNQLVNFTDRSSTISGISLTRHDGVIFEYSGTAAAKNYIDVGAFTADDSFVNSIVVGHRYLLVANSSDTRLYMVINNPYTDTGYPSVTTAVIYTPTSAPTYLYVRIKCSNGETLSGRGGIGVFDLTQMFGTAIADRAYAMEQATAGSGIAWLKSMGFFTADYYPYDAGTLKSVEGLTAHSMVGFNQWDEEWKLGTYATSDGTYVVDTEHICCTNPIKAVAGATYYFNTAGANAHICFMDASMNLISSNINVNNATLTAPANSRYILFNMALLYGVTYNHDICINLSDPAKNGTYEPYVKHSYPLDSTLTLRGIPKLDANNQLYYDGDEYESDGTVTRRYGVITFDGTQPDSAFGVTALTDATQVSWMPYINIGVGLASFISDKLIYSNWNAAALGWIWPSNVPRMFMGLPSTVTTPAEVNTWFRNNPTTVIYPIATPTTEEADPYQNPQILDPYGTEEYVTTGIVPIGHDTFYPENLRAKIEGLPFDFATLIAPTESTYKATRAYSTNNLFIVDNVLYKATTSIASGGTITPGTNCTATTLAEIIAALS